MTQEMIDKLAMAMYYTIIDAEERILEEIQSNTQTLTIIGIAGICVTVIIGIAILWNQRKIKKMLRDLQEQNRKDDAANT